MPPKSKTTKTAPKKRGRKPKPKTNVEKPPPKKRGRKPKGGKIIKKTPPATNSVVTKQPNVILHLKCSSTELNNLSDFNVNYNPNINNPESYNILSNTKMYDLPYSEINTNKESYFMENENLARKEFFDSLKVNNGGHQV